MKKFLLSVLGAGGVMAGGLLIWNVVLPVIGTTLGGFADVPAGLRHTAQSNHIL